MVLSTCVFTQIPLFKPNSEKDGRTTHEAISVGKGTKFAANVWIHLYDVVETQKRGCT